MSKKRKAGTKGGRATYLEDFCFPTDCPSHGQCLQCCDSHAGIVSCEGRREGGREGGREGEEEGE